MLDALCFLVGLIGAALIALGAWLILPAAGYIVGGLFCVSWSWLMSHSLAKQPTEGA